jgi:hypothetical protein
MAVGLAAAWMTLPVFAQGVRRVVYVTPSGAKESEFAPLIRAELRSAGFSVDSRSVPEPVGAEALERTTRETASIASVVVETEDGRSVARVWLTDRSTGEGVLRDVVVRGEGDEGARLLALSVAELLHASALELSAPEPDRSEGVPTLPVSAVGGPSAAPPGEPARAPGGDTDVADHQPAEAPSAAVWAVGVGPAVLGGPGGMPIGVAPLLVLSWQATTSWAVEGVAAGPAIGTVDHELGSATTDQELALLRARVALPNREWAPHVGVGGGIHRIGARGEAAEPLRSEGADRVGFLASLGLGLRWYASRELRLLGEMNAAVVAPRPVLRFAGRSSAATPEPLLFGVVALELAW